MDTMEPDFRYLSTPKEVQPRNYACDTDQVDCEGRLLYACDLYSVADGAKALYLAKLPEAPLVPSHFPNPLREVVARLLEDLQTDLLHHAAQLQRLGEEVPYQKAAWPGRFF